MTYSIETVDINNVAIEYEIRLLIKEVYQYPELLPEKYFAQKLDSKASMPSLFLVAKEAGKIIGCNGFVAVDCTHNGNKYVAYLSCWTATHPLHQGKKVFINIMDAAKRLLKESGAGFIYGIANDKSNPILIKKHAFKEIPAVFVRIPNVPFLVDSYFSKSSFTANDAVVLNEAQLAAYKKSETPGEIIAVSYNASFAWGKIIRKKKLGIMIHAFYIGGITLQNADDLPIIIKRIFKEHNVPVIQLTSCVSNSFNVLLKKWKPSRHMNGFIYYNLIIPDFDHFNLMIGAIDVF